MCPYSFIYERQVSRLRIFRIKIGNIVAQVQSNYSYIERICEPYLSDVPPNCTISIDDKMLECEREAIEAVPNTGTSSVDSEDWFLEVYALLHRLLPVLPEHKMLFMHGSAIKYREKAYIFIAPSGTGKSTHSRLWKERFGEDVTIINDDKPFLAFRDHKVYLCGTPWRGKHNIGENIEAELAGICILSQGSKNCMRSVSAVDAVQDIIQQSNLHRYETNSLLALDLIDELLNTVPVYRLSCTPTLDAVDAALMMVKG